LAILTIIAWIIDSLILLYFVHMLARLGVNWSGGQTIITLTVMIAASIVISAVLVSTSKERWARRLALLIAGALPLIGGLTFLGAALIMLLSILAGDRWN
jgi:hypothetical protein